MKIIGVLAIAAFFLAIPNLCVCQEYQLLFPDGLQPGRSLSIRPFALNELAPYRYNQESLQTLQNALADNLKNALQKLGRFSKVVVISENETPETALLLEGSFSQINQGNRLGRVFMASPATIRISSVLKQVEDDKTVLWVHCNDSRIGGLFGENSPPGIIYHIPNQSGKDLMHKSAEKISKEIVKIIRKSEWKPASGKPVVKW